MHLNIFIALLLTLVAGGHSLKCYQCTDVTGPCSDVQTCVSNLTTCASAKTVITGNITATIINRSCYVPQYCINGSVNVGIYRSEVSMQCCNTDLCNSQNVPDSSSNSNNGKQCYYCDGKSCLNKLNCLGTEDSCFTADAANVTIFSSTVKGCVSKSLCDAASQLPQSYVNFSCCQGNLCNSAQSITQSLHFFLWLFIFYIMFH